MKEVRILHVFMFVVILFFGALINHSAENQLATGTFEISISPGMTPVFSWNPDVLIGKLVVENEKGMEVWGTETEGKNEFKSPIEYSKNPPQAIEPEKGKKLIAGKKYKVILYKWIKVEPEEFEHVGEKEFVPVESESNEFSDLLNFKKAKFGNPTKIDNPWDPLIPGTKYVYEGHTIEEGDTLPHQIVFTVTDLTKVIAGVRTLVIYDRDYSDGVLEEAELTFFAQDDDGNVWHFGQYRETYSEMEFVGGRIWIEGFPEGSKAGIMMQADPLTYQYSYSQGFAPYPFNWTDRARIYKKGEQTRVPAGDFKDVIIIDEYNQEEPNAFQLKYYAKGVGNVRIGWRGDDQQQETMVLVEKSKLSAEELTQVRKEALELEKRGYIYSNTSPIEPLSHKKMSE